MGKIGIDARLIYYRDGGISTYIKALVLALAALDTEHEYTVFHSRKDPQTISEQFHRKSLWTPAHHRIERLALSIELSTQGLDIFHSPDFIPPYRGARAHVITVHDLTFLHYPDYLTADSRHYYNNQIVAACQHADHILAVSQTTKDDLMQMLGVAAEKITVQPHGVSEKFSVISADEAVAVSQKLAIPQGCILHVGTWEPRKNIIGLLNGYQQFLAQHPDAPPVVLVGRPGWLFEETQREIEKLKLGDHVLWRSNVSDEDLPAVYNLASCIVSVSHYEGFGMPLLEGMACGAIPIIANRSSLPEVTGDIGIKIDGDDPTSLAVALEQAVFDTDWRQTTIENGLKRAATFTWKHSAEIALAVYKSLL